MDERTVETDDRPWEQPGVVRRDCEPHRAELLGQLGTIAVICGFLTAILVVTAVVSLPLGIAVCIMARQDLAKMQTREMDPQGAADTERALQTGIFSLFVSAAMLVTFGIPIGIIVLAH